MARAAAPIRQATTYDLVVPAGKALHLAKDSKAASRMLAAMPLATPGDWQAAGLIRSVDHLALMLEAARVANGVRLQRQRDGLAAYQPADRALKRDDGRRDVFLAHCEGVPLGEAMFFWSAVRMLPPARVMTLKPDALLDEGMRDKLEKARYFLRSLTVEAGATLVVDKPFLDVSGGMLYIAEGGSIVLADGLAFLHIQATDLKGESRYLGGEIPGWEPNILARGSNGGTFAPERTAALAGATGARGADGADSQCHDFWEFKSNVPAQCGAPGRAGHVGGAGWDGCNASAGRTVMIHAKNYLGGITIDCTGGAGESGGNGGIGGAGGRGGNGGFGYCGPHANGGSGGKGGDGGPGGVGGNGGDGGSAYLYYQALKGKATAQFLVSGGSAGAEGENGTGGPGGAPGQPGRGQTWPQPDDLGPLPTRGADGANAWHPVIKRDGVAGVAVFEKE